MELGLKGKVVLVTGGSKGIGLACASGFAAEGARVAICSRSRENVDKASAELKDVFDAIADLVDAVAAERMIETVEDRLGPIDILVNSAGAAKRTPPDELNPAVWREAFDAKFFSYINVIDPLVKRMAKRGSGVIVSVIGVGGKVASSTHLAGGSANAALMLATAGLGATYAGNGVRVVGVSPSSDGDGPGGGGPRGRRPACQHLGRGSAPPRRRAAPVGPNGDGERDRRRGSLPGLAQGELHYRRDPIH